MSFTLAHLSLHKVERGLWAVVMVYVFCRLFTPVRNWLRAYYYVQRLPGPQGHPILGNRQLWSPYKALKVVAEWRDKYPGGFHRCMVALYPFIIAHTPDAVQTILGRKYKHNEKSLSYECLKSFLGEGLITSKGERWHSHRKLITPTFHFNILESFVEVFVARTEDLMRDLEVARGDHFFDISPFTRKLTLDFILETAMGAPTQSTIHQHNEILRALHKLEQIGMYRIVRPWLLPDFIFQFTKLSKEEKMFKDIFYGFTKEIILQRKKALQEYQICTEDSYGDNRLCGGKQRAIFMDLLITSSQGGTLLSDQDIMEEVNTFIMAGQNTTQLAINYCLFLLGENLDIQAKAYKELYEIFGESDRQPTMEDLKGMKYLENCIKEALRLFPSVPVIGRRLTEDEHIGKYILPEGTDVVIFPYVLHRDPTHFPDPEKFNPDNFSPEVVKRRHPYAYIPFSAGPRNCIGQRYALLAEKTVLSAILRKYQVESLQTRQELTPLPITVLVPKNGIKLKLTPRQ